MTDDPLPEEVLRLLRDHELEAMPDEYARALADRIRWARRKRQAKAPAKEVPILASRQRQQVITTARRLLRHMQQPPRDPEATTRARCALAERIDSLGAVVRMARDPVGFDISAMVEPLRVDRSPTSANLEAFIAAVERIPNGEGAPLPSDAAALVRSGVTAWRVVRGAGGYWYGDQRSDNPGTTGPLPRFLSDVLALAGIEPAPSADALHSQIRALKNL